MKEFRRNVRASCSVPVQIEFLDTAKSEAVGSIYDISSGGLKMETAAEMHMMEAVFLSFVILNKYHFKRLNGNIIRVINKSGKYEVGIRFETAADKELLSTAVKELVKGGKLK